MSVEKQLYTLLREHPGDYFSADQIGRTLGTDRGSVRLLLEALQLLLLEDLNLLLVAFLASRGQSFMALIRVIF